MPPFVLLIIIVVADYCLQNVDQKIHYVVLIREQIWAVYSVHHACHVKLVEKSVNLVSFSF